MYVAHIQLFSLGIGAQYKNRYNLRLYSLGCAYRRLVTLSFVLILKQNLTSFNEKVTQSEQKTVAYVCRN